MSKAKKVTILVVTIIFLVAAFVCVTCDYFLSERISWSVIVILSLIYLWAGVFCCLRSGVYAIRNTLLVVSLGIIPYLADISLIINRPLVFHPGLCIACISIAGLWVIYEVVRRNQNRIFFSAGLVAIISIPLALGIVYMTNIFYQGENISLTSNLFHIVTGLIIAGVCFATDRFRKDTERSE